MERRGILILILICALILSAVFGLYEIVERAWLADADMRLIHFLHVLRGVGASVLIGIVVTVYLMKHRAPFLPAAFQTEQTFLGEGAKDRLHVQWLVFLRWIAGIVALVSSFFATEVAHILPERVLLPLLLISGAILAVNSLFSLVPPAFLSSRGGILLQIFADIFLLTLLLNFSGGVENPFYFLYLVHVVLGGILLPKREAALATLGACCFFAALVLGELSEILPHYTISLFPHETGHVHGVGTTIHASHDPLFVLTRLGTFTFILIFLGGFTAIAMENLRKSHLQLVTAGRMAAAGELLGNIAHEINNPIGIVLAKTKLLLAPNRKTLLSPQVLNSLEKIEKHSERIANLTGGLLNFCRPSPGKKSPLSMHDLIEKTLDLMQESLPSKNIRLEKHLGAGVSRISANEKEIQQILLNLLNNAADAMPKGGGLTLRTHNERDHAVNWLVLTVSDTGCGIPKEEIARIFEPFFTTKPEGKGTGLGLAIVRGLVHSHNGAVDVESCLQRGTSFKIRFPVIA